MDNFSCNLCSAFEVTSDSTETALCTMKVTKFNRLSELIANNTLVYVLGEHGTVVVGFGGSLGIVLCSEELARQIHVLGGSRK
jgi:hypothetical protein